jgi:hypothetical protein
VGGSFDLDQDDALEIHVRSLMLLLGEPGARAWVLGQETGTAWLLHSIVRYHRIAKAESQDRRDALDQIHALSVREDQIT